jgi:hypothetical protein
MFASSSLILVINTSVAQQLSASWYQLVPQYKLVPACILIPSDTLLNLEVPFQSWHFIPSFCGTDDGHQLHERTLS